MPTQWEYCRAQLDAGQYSQRQTDRMPYYVRVTVEYYGADAPQPLTFSEDTDQIDKPNRLWGRVLGQLGAAEWELVNVYLGGPKDFGILSAMAYFKRPVAPGRQVNEPRLTLA
jgi:hypothetical protein